MAVRIQVFHIGTMGTAHFHQERLQLSCLSACLNHYRFGQSLTGGCGDGVSGQPDQRAVDRCHRLSGQAVKQG